MRLLICLTSLLVLLALPIENAAAGGLGGTLCTCRNRDGSRHTLGSLVCLNVDGRRYLARCEMALNVPNWKKILDSCPLAAGSDLRQSVPAAL